VSVRTLCKSSFTHAQPDGVEHIVASLDELGLLFPDGDRVLSLVQPSAPTPLKIDQWYNALETEATRAHRPRRGDPVTALPPGVCAQS